MEPQPLVKELTDFTLQAYQKLLTKLMQTHKIVPICKIPYEGSYIGLRHDIDISVAASLKMAELEHDMGVKSTYFVLLSSPFYNVHDGKIVQMLKKISKLGHEIGLHYHIEQYRMYKRNMTKTLDKEVQMLEQLLGRKVYSIARHGEWDRDPFFETKGYINANHPKIRGELYVHDSCRTWITLKGLQQLLNQPPNKILLLVHPGNWNLVKRNRAEFTERFIQTLEREVLFQKNLLAKMWKQEFIQKYDRSVKGVLPLQPKDKKVQHKKVQLIKLKLINTFLGWRIHKILQNLKSFLGEP